MRVADDATALRSLSNRQQSHRAGCRSCGDRLEAHRAIGRALSRDDEAYRYLVASIEAFSSRPDFESAVRIAGFDVVRGETLFPGVCGLVTARRSA